MKRIIIIGCDPLTLHLKKRFYIDNYLSFGFDVEYWDMSQYFSPGISLPDELVESYIYKYNSLSALQNRLDEIIISNTLFIIEQSQSVLTKDFFNLLKKRECYMIRIHVYGNTTLKYSKWRNIKRILYLHDFNITKIIKKIIMKSMLYKYKKNGEISNFKKIFSSSKLDKPTNKINHPDYDEYRKTLLNTSEFSSKEYILFLDIYFPNHPDLCVYPEVKLADAVKYRKSLNNYFNYLEKKYNLPVIIAAHPKSNYQSDDFLGRKIIKYKTNELVLYAQKIITHISTSISYVVLANKPVVFISTNGYEAFKYLNYQTEHLSLVMGKKLYNIDKSNYNDIIFTRIDDALRKQYIFSYLTSNETKDKFNEDILIKSLSSL